MRILNDGDGEDELFDKLLENFGLNGGLAGNSTVVCL